MAGKSWGRADDSGFSPEEQQLIEYYTDDKYKEWSVENIARALGRTERSVVNKWHRLRKQMEDEGEEPPEKTFNTSELPEIGISYEHEGNTTTVSSTGFRIRSLKDLIEHCNIDEDKFHIYHHEVTTWEVGAKTVERDLEYVDGKATGTVKSKGLQVETLYRVEARMIPREPMPVNPIVKPVIFEIPKVKVNAPKSNDGMRKAIVLHCPQIGFYRDNRNGALTPYHDRRALDIAVKAIEWIQPDEVIITGDWLDLPMMTKKYSRTPDMFFTTWPAAIEGGFWIAQIRMAAPDAIIKFIEGNHEARMNSMLVEHLIDAVDLRSVDGVELPPLLSIPRILALHEYDVEYISPYPNGRVWLNDYIHVEHGDVARGSGRTIPKVIGESDTTHIMGHIHRIEIATRTIHMKDGFRIIFAASFGALCSVTEVPGKKSRQNWQQGFGMVEYDESPHHNVEPFAIHNGVCYIRGHRFEGESRLDALRKATVGTEAEHNW